MAPQATNAAPSALCVIHRAGVQPRPQPKPTHMDFGLRPHTVLVWVWHFNGLHPRNPCKSMDYYTFTGRLSWCSLLNVDRAPVRENLPAKDRRLNHWVTPPTKWMWTIALLQLPRRLPPNPQGRSPPPTLYINPENERKHVNVSKRTTSSTRIVSTCNTCSTLILIHDTDIGNAGQEMTMKNQRWKLHVTVAEYAVQSLTKKHKIFTSSYRNCRHKLNER